MLNANQSILSMQGDPPALAPYRIQSVDSAHVPASLFYIRDFVTQEESDKLVSRVFSVPRQRWTVLRNRRLQSWGVVPKASYLSNQNRPKSSLGSFGDDQDDSDVVPTERLPAWLATVGDRIASLGAFDCSVSTTQTSPDCCLINEYRPGQGIFPHTDGGAYVPAVATLSLGEWCRLDLCPRRSTQSSTKNENILHAPTVSIVLAPRSLFVLRADAYTQFMHGIAESFDIVVRKLDPLAATTDDANLPPVCVNADDLVGQDGYQEHGSQSIVSIPRIQTRISLTFRVCKSSVESS